MSQRLSRNLHLLANDLVAHGAVPLGQRRRRIIALVGAGASAPAGIPTSRRLKDLILDLVVDSGLVPQRVIDDQLREDWGHGVELATLEELTQVACKLAPVRQRILEELRRLCLAPSSSHHSLPPLLGYEILGHLVKHGFIDHVISMNFDEILDEALQNELGPHSLIKIVSERDIAPLSPASPAHISFLVKPHGTISSPLSLRFTRDNVAMFPREIVAFIKNHLLPPPSPGASLRDGATLIVLGYSMRDLVIEGILRDAHLARIYRIDTIVPKRLSAPGLEGPRSLDERLSRKEHLLVSRGGVNILDKLWDAMSKCAARRQLSLVSIARHHILTTLFRVPGSTPARAQARFVDHRDRLYAELLLAAVKAKGKFNTYNLARILRVNRYFGDGPSDGAREGLAVLRRMVEAPESLFANEHRRHEFAGENFYLYDFEAALLRLRELATRDPRSRRDTRSLSRLRRWYGQVRRGEEVEVERSPDPRNAWQFVEPRPLHTLAELHAATRRMLLNRDANHVFIVCETGDWLRRRWVHAIARERRRLGLRPVRCEMITVMRAEFAPLGLHSIGLKAEGYRAGAFRLFEVASGPPNPIELHWWEHNRHLTLVADMRPGGEIRPLEGVYFRRRLNMPLIAPVYLRARADAGALLRMVHRYRRKYVKRTFRVEATMHAQEIDDVLTDAYRGKPRNRPTRERTPGIEAHVAQRGHTYLAAYHVQEGGARRAVGILSFARQGREVDLSVVGVRPVWHGYGVGRILIEAMEQQVSGARLIHLMTPASNERFLEEQGYRRDGKRAQPAHRISMEKRLR